VIWGRNRVDARRVTGDNFTKIRGMRAENEPCDEDENPEIHRFEAIRGGRVGDAGLYPRGQGKSPDRESDPRRKLRDKQEVKTWDNHSHEQVFQRKDSMRGNRWGSKELVGRGGGREIKVSEAATHLKGVHKERSIKYRRGVNSRREKGQKADKRGFGNSR